MEAPMILTTGMSDATDSKHNDQQHSRKRVGRTNDRGRRWYGRPSHASRCCFMSRCCSSLVQQDEGEREMAIHGYFTLKTVVSKVVYWLTFPSRFAASSSARGTRQDSTPGCEHPESATLRTEMTNLQLFAVWTCNRLLADHFLGENASRLIRRHLRSTTMSSHNTAPF